jgi:hypothetical protein
MCGKLKVDSNPERKRYQAELTQSKYRRARTRVGDQQFIASEQRHAGRRATVRCVEAAGPRVPDVAIQRRARILQCLPNRGGHCERCLKPQSRDSVDFAVEG